MTTVACDGKMIAADGLVTGNGLIHDRASPKLYRLRDGRVAGFSGSTFVTSLAVAFLNGDRDDFDAGSDFEAIILSEDGTAECMDEKGRTYRQSIPCVTGSGGGVALGAMAAGKDAFEAVKIAAEIDMATGGVCTFMTPGRVSIVEGEE